LANLAKYHSFTKIFSAKIFSVCKLFPHCKRKVYGSVHVSDDKMALLCYFKLKRERQQLPDPNGPLCLKVPTSGISAANLCVSKLLDKTSDDSNGECNVTGARGPYTVFTPAEIGKGAAEIRTAAMRYYASNYPELSRKLKETSVRRFKDMYKDELKKLIHSSACESPPVVPKKRGRPLLISEAT